MERLFGAIPEVLKGLGPDGGTSEAMVFAAWKQCAGPLIIERTHAIEYAGSRLVIAVSDVTWRAHLEDLSPQIVAKLNATLESGTVKFIEFRVDAGALRKDSGRSVSAVKTKRPELANSLIEAADAITDPELRNSFLAAAAAYLERK